MDGQDSEPLGPRIRRLRLAREMSQSDLARALETDSQTVSRWETGKILTPSRGHLRRLAEALQVSREELVHGRPPAATGEDRRVDALQPLREAVVTVQAAGDDAVAELVRQVVLYVDRRWPRLGGQK